MRVGSLDRGDGNEISLGLNTSPASSIFRLYGLSFVLQAAVPSDRPYVVNGGVVVVNPPSDGNYETADTITVEVTFSEAVTVTGKPTFPLLIGSVTRFMAYASGSDSAKLVFTYDVAEQDSDLDGISSARRLLSVPSTDAITAVLDNTKRVYDGPLNLSTGLTVNLDTDPPSPGSGAQLDSVDRKIIEFPFDEKLDTDRDPPAVSVFTVTVDGTEADLVSVEFNDSVDLLDHIIKLTMSTAIAAGATVTVGYDNPDDATALADAAGNQVETFSGAIVANIPAAPVVSLIAGDGKITASWNEPADGGESIVSYEVRYKAAGDTDYTLVNRTDTAALTETIIGLDNGTEYTVQVRAETDSDAGPWSTPVLATPVASMNSAPGGPHLFWGNTKVLVRWIPPAGAADDSDLEGWLVQWKDPAGTAQEQEWSTDRQSSVSKFHDADADGTDDWLSFELEISAHNDTEYDFRVGARFAGDDVEWTDLATTTPKLVEDDIPSIFTSDLRFGRLDEEETFGADRTKIAIRFRDHAIRTVTAEGLADYTVRRTFYFADYPGEPQYPITAIFFNVVSKHSDPPPGRTITTLHEGAGPDDWGGFDYPPSYMDIPSSLFTLFWAATAAGGRSANGQVHQGSNPGEQNIHPTSVPQEKAVLGAPVVGDGELTVVWQDLLWAGTEAYDYQLCVQWKSGMEEFDDGLDDEGNTISSGLGDRTVILSNQERTDALINGSYTVAGLANGTSYDVRVAYCEAGESSTKIDPSTISNVMSATTESGLTVPHDWSLRPDGVPTGETFHLLFVTSTTRDALSGDIADYDAHVQAALADGGHTDIRDYSSQFKALAGTAGGAAPKSHTGTDPVDGPGVEIWWLNGPKAADDYDDFYDYDRANGANCGFNADCYDGWGHSNPARVETGESKTFLDPGVTGQNLEDVFVWTGVWFNGERASEWHLGTTREIIAGVGAATFGVPYENDQVWLRSDNGTSATLQNFEQGGDNISLGLYGLSAALYIEPPDSPYATVAEIIGFPEDGTSYWAQETIEFAVTFSETVVVDTTSGTPRLTLRIGDAVRYADYSFTDDVRPELSFFYLTTSDDQDLDGIAIDKFALELNGGTIRRPDTTVDAALTHTAVAADERQKVRVPPVITGVAFTSGPPMTDDDTYGLGEVIEITVTFNEDVDVAGDPQFGFDAGGEKLADYDASSSSSDALVFVYTVLAADSDTDGIEIGNHASTIATLRLDTDDAITDDVSGVDASLEHQPLGVLANSKVDGSREPDTTAPSVKRVRVILGSTPGIFDTIEIVFNEHLDRGSHIDEPVGSDFEVTIDGIATYDPNSVGITSATTLRLGYVGTRLAAGETIRVSYTQNALRALADPSGNKVADFAGVLAENLPAKPVVTLTFGAGEIRASWEAPADGGSAITRYEVQWKIAAQTWTEAETAGQENIIDSANFGGFVALVTDDVYMARVRAVNGVGNSEWSSDTTVGVSWSAASYAALEGHSGTTVTLKLSAAPTGDVTVPISVDLVGGAEAGDYSGVPVSVTFDSSSTLVDGLPTESFVVVATDDGDHDEYVLDEALTLSFGELPSGVSPGTQSTTTVALVDNEIPADSELVPDGIAIGDRFRLLFVTSGTHKAESADIEVYNAFVQRSVGDGHADIAGYSAQFQALASTATVDARDNTATNPNKDGTGVPIWWLNGDGDSTADNYRDFYDGEWDNHDPGRDEDGVEVDFDSGDRVWTGTDTDGTARNPLGGASPGRGKPSDSGQTLFFGTSQGIFPDPLYGLSYVLHAAAPVDTPYVTGVATVDAPDSAYRSGDTITLEVTFSEAVTVTGAPTFPLSIGSDTRQAQYDAGESTATVLRFTYAVTDNDYDDGRISNDGLELVLPTGTSITRQGSPSVAAYPGSIVWDPGLKVNPRARLTSIEITSTPEAATNTYGQGEDIEFTVTFDAPVTVTSDPTAGDVKFRFFLGGTQSVQDRRDAGLTSGDGTPQLVFTYTVLSGDEDDPDMNPVVGVWVGGSGDHADNLGIHTPFPLEGEQSIEGPLGKDANLTHPGLSRRRADHDDDLVDGSLTGADARLASLSLSGISLVPAFAAGTLSYTASADTSVTSTTVTATRTQTGGSSALTITPTDANSTATGHQVTLTAGTTTITVTVTAPNGTTTRVYTIDVTVATASDPPANLRAFAGDGRIDVEWDPPATGGAEGGYRVRWRESSVSAFATSDAGDVAAGVIEHAITGLTNGDTYVVRVVPLDASSQEGPSADSAEVTVGRPKAVRDLTVATRRLDFRVSWDAPDERGEGFAQDAEGDPVLVYRVSWTRQGQDADDGAQYQSMCQSSTALSDFYEYYDLSANNGSVSFKFRAPAADDVYDFTVEARFETNPATTTQCHNQTDFGAESTMSATATDTPADATDEDHAAVRAALESVVAAHESDQPWMRTALGHIPTAEVQAEDLKRGVEGRVGNESSVTSSTMDLSYSEVESLKLDIDSDLWPEDRLAYTAVHELAHVWTLDSTLHDDAASRSAVGAALLYFFREKYDGLAEAELCATETLADTIAHLAAGTPEGSLSHYSETCFAGDTRQGPARAEEDQALHAMHPSGTTPGGTTGDAESSWLTDTYADDGDSARAWVDVKSLSAGYRALVMNLLQDSFGGYCSIGVANTAAFAGQAGFDATSDVTDPWNDGGCEPGAPTGVTAPAVSTGGNVDVAWTAPASSGGAPITRYTVQWRTTTQTWPQAVAASQSTGVAATPHTITGLDSAEQYTVRVRATNSIGDGEWSDDTTAGTARALPPQNLRAAADGGTVRLEWDAPDGDPVTGYRIERRPAGPRPPNRGLGDDDILVGDTGSADTVYVDDTVDPGVGYRYRVAATGPAGAGETSEWVRAGPADEPELGDGPPGAPRNLTITAGDREITLSWEPPADNGSAPATRYRVEWRIDGKDYDKSHWGISHKTTYTRTHLANGVNYVFWVKAENGDGNRDGPYGPASEEVSGTPTSGLAVDLGTPVLSSTKALHRGMVRLDWEDVEDAGWYVVQHYHIDGGSGQWLDLPAAGVDVALHGSSAVVSNLGGISWLRVGAMSCAGESEWSEIKQLFMTDESAWDGVPVPEVAPGDEIEPCPVVLGTPVLSSTKTLHHGTVKLDWQDIEDAGWYVVQHYHIDRGSGQWLDLPAVGVDVAFHGSSAVVSNLGGISWLRVRAMSCAAESEWSEIEQLFMTDESAWEGVPVPEVAQGDETEPCPEDVDAPDNSRTAQAAPDNSETAQEAPDNSATAQEAPDNSRTAQAAPDNSRTAQAAPDNSGTATAAVAGAQPTEPPAKPTGLSATASHDSVTLTWNDPGDDSITGYVILRRVRENDVGGEFSELVPDTGSTATTYTDDTVAAGLTYTYRIKAINGAGTSERSRWFHIDTPAAPAP